MHYIVWKNLFKLESILPLKYNKLMLRRTRLSLMYVASYLSLAGLGWFLDPELSLRLFFSTGHYDSTFVRVAGALLIVLSILVIQVIRHRLEAIYTTIILVRVFLCAVWILLYILTKDPLFLITLAIVGVGVILSTLAFISDKKYNRL